MRKLFIFIMIYLVGATPVMACVLNQIAFGSSTSQIVDQYNLDVLGISEEGEFTASEMGNIVCDSLPEQSIMEFTFIDNVFVKVNIKTPNISEELLNFAKKSFGENDDSTRKKSSDGKTTLALWSKNPHYSVVYSTHDKSHQGEFENLDITSKSHAKLFEKIVLQNSKNIAEYFKTHNHQNSAVTNTSSGGGNATKNGTYDPKGLEELKKKYDKDNEAWRKKNQENPSGGR